jgi:hypothetical protein
MYQVCTFLPCNDQIRFKAAIEGDTNHQGKLSSASTGRFAALLFSFAVVLSELNKTDGLVGVTSTSISSS